MQIITEKQPIVADQAGVWEGEYVHLDADHNIIDRHKSRLVCRLTDGPDGVAKLMARRKSATSTAPSKATACGSRTT